MEENIKLEAFSQKIAGQGKNIRLPIKLEYGQKKIAMLQNLLAKGLLSGTAYDELVKDINSSSLDEETYREFLELTYSIQELKSGHTIEELIEGVQELKALLNGEDGAYLGTYVDAAKKMCLIMGWEYTGEE